MEETQLNHPWTIYHSEVMSSYIKYSVYYEELIRLREYFSQLVNEITHLTDDQVVLNNIIIGTPMECEIHKKQLNSKYFFQWQQLFPVYINDFLDMYETKGKYPIVNNIIISPDEIFMDLDYNEPVFTRLSGFDFVKISNRKYQCINSSFTINVNIFTCPFPQLETRTAIIEKINTFVKLHLLEYPIKDFNPSASDIKFVNEFYSLIEILASNTMLNEQINLVICSYATFRNIRDYDNYGLFYSLLELANKYKIIATEWSFSESNYKLKIVSKIKPTVDYINYLISYIDPTYSGDFFTYYEDLTKEQLRELKKITNYYDLINFVCIKISFPYNNLKYQKMIR